MKSSSRSSTIPSNQPALSLDLGAFNVIPHRQTGTVEIPALRTDTPVTCSVEQFLKAGVFFLSTPMVQERCPHAAVPLMAVEHPSWLMGFTINSALQAFQNGYIERFGTPDHDGKDSLFPPRSGNTAHVSWGNGAINLDINRKDHTVTLSGISKISVELLVDVFTTMLRDPYTGAAFKDYFAPYLRRWGENAFRVTHLKEGIPSSLTTEARIPKTTAFTPPTASAPSVSELPQASIPESTLVLPSVPQTPAPRRGRPPGKTNNPTNLNRREQELQERETLLIEREDQVAKQEASLKVAQEQLAADQAELKRAQQELELEKQIIREEGEKASNLLAHAQATLTAAESETAKTEAIRHEISQLLQAVVNNPSES